MFDLPNAQSDTVVVTASRSEEDVSSASASVTLIGPERLERIGAPLLNDLLRIAPSVAVSTSGPAGSLTDVRIRGAEANHTLLFVEGIRANDPASGNAPRFELVNADLASRIEVVRGPQSALWGSEAIGGVIAVQGQPAGPGSDRGLIEAGSFDTRRAAARASVGTAEQGISFGIAGQRSDGIDSFSRDGERDGYHNLGARASAAWRLSPALMLGASGFALRGTSEFDGFDPATFLRGDTLDRTKNRLAAGRIHATLGSRSASYAMLSTSLLGSSNRNLLGDDPLNRTDAGRRTISVEAGHRFGRHGFVLAAEGERETFEARDTAFGGATRQDRVRRHQSVLAQYKISDVGPLSTDVAIRHDVFSRFDDATTVRGAAMLELGRGVAFVATYGQGIAQPSFFDLFGFFPGSFRGNPSLRPEKSSGAEISLRFRRAKFNSALTLYRQRLTDEIVDLFDFPLSTTVNSPGKSRRRGVEAEIGWTPSKALRMTATYAHLDASEPSVGNDRIREQRRPKHSGSIAVDGQAKRLSYGAIVAYTGRRIDSDFASFPARRVALSAYWLASGQMAYRLTSGFDATLRIANAFDEHYQDVVGYRTEGRSIHAGLRVTLGR